MADTPEDMNGEGPVDRDILAGEYALGVLEGAELREAQRLNLSDPTFAAQVKWWNNRLNLLAEHAEAIEPSPGVWRAVEAKLSSEVSEIGQVTPLEQPPRRGPAPWSIATALLGGGLAAAALALYLNTPTTPVTTAPPIVEAPEPGPQLVAQIASEDDALRLAGVIDSAAERLSLNVSGFAPGEGQTPVLWVVPEGGAPTSLGRIPEDGSFARDLTPGESALLAEGAALAVTYEDAAAPSYDAPTTPILLAGPLTEV
ncbi:anti-sigma factor [Qipengyuania atrilutea]|uniref:Anti-sigma factor n=1 Tax=Qipengyuania atrilutea TaxID=2744473 RepID=A0A850H1Q1_9SPHN|nr:anti-sigma factor [Actirhodobacter atriluteus]NVD44616.1 anti-sigma factor [Actirhodobacter atriluteus]